MVIKTPTLMPGIIRIMCRDYYSSGYPLLSHNPYQGHWPCLQNVGKDTEQGANKSTVGNAESVGSTSVGGAGGAGGCGLRASSHSGSSGSSASSGAGGAGSSRARARGHGRRRDEVGGSLAGASDLLAQVLGSDVASVVLKALALVCLALVGRDGAGVLRHVGGEPLLQTQLYWRELLSQELVLKPPLPQRTLQVLNSARHPC